MSKKLSVSLTGLAATIKLTVLISAASSLLSISLEVTGPAVPVSKINFEKDNNNFLFYLK